jgi:CRISPR/Cas system-associated exonuclease Cas4 (RecB family)
MSAERRMIKMTGFNRICLRVKIYYGGMTLMKLSKSRLTTFITCPQKYFISYTLSIRPLKTSDDLLIGSSTHHLIATYYLKRMANEPCDLKIILDDFWSKYDLNNADFETLEDLAAAKLESLQLAEVFLKETEIEPLYAEYPFTLPLINVQTGDVLEDVELNGIIDLIDRPNGNGRTRALEIKTKSKKPDDFTAQTSIELTCYAYWLRFLHDQESVPVGYLNIIKTKKPYLHWQPQERTEKDFVGLYFTIKKVSENIMDERFYRNPGVHCNWCDFKPICINDMQTTEKVFGHEAVEKLRQVQLS